MGFIVPVADCIIYSNILPAENNNYEIPKLMSGRLDLKLYSLELDVIFHITDCYWSNQFFLQTLFSQIGNYLFVRNF